GENINTEDGWEAQPSLSADGKTLYFASAREESEGIDIYYSVKDSSGAWGPAVNMGRPINSAGNDKSPFIHSDSKTLYFASTSSDERQGLGGYDIFYSRLGDDGRWQEPVNIGYPINSAEDEHGFVVSTDGRKVYFASDKLKGSSGGLDIFSFELYRAARPDKVLFLKGEVMDEAGKAIPDAVVEVKNMKTKEVTRIAVDSIDGRYTAVVNIGREQDVLMNVKAENKVFNSRLFTGADTVKDVFQKVDVELQQIELNKPYRINDIHYKTNSAEIQEGSKPVLDEFIAYLQQYPEIQVEIRGHTDNVGNAADNLALSSDRAYSVMAYLQQHGIDKSRLSFRGYGETKPIASNNSPSGRAQNRRTEFVITAE
ncbi:MAG: OmpA family protein, partial [Flavobacteriales bacterium]